METRVNSQHSYHKPKTDQKKSDLLLHTSSMLVLHQPKPGKIPSTTNLPYSGRRLPSCRTRSTPTRTIASNRLSTNLPQSDRRLPSCRTRSAPTRMIASNRLSIDGCPTDDRRRLEDNMWVPFEQETSQRRTRIFDKLAGCTTWMEALENQKRYCNERKLVPKSALSLLATTKSALMSRLGPMDAPTTQKWKETIRALSKASRREGNVNGPPIPDSISLGEVLHVANTLPELPRLALMMQVAHASRLRTILKLQTRDVLMSPFAKTGCDIALTVRSHKTEESQDAYTIHLTLDQSTVIDLQRLTRRRSACRYLFPPQLWRPIREEMLMALKSIGLQVRSIRPLLLKTLAASEDRETLRLFSRHSSDKGLQTYLDHGLFQKKEADATLALSAKVLMAASAVRFKKPMRLAEKRTVSDSESIELSSTESE